MMCVVPDERYKREVELAENPEGSLPAQMQSWKESQALYRLLDEPDVTFAALIQPHVEQTREQANASEVVLLVQHTTDIDLSHRHQSSGVGQIGNERGRGFFVQTVLAVRPEMREVLGCLAQEPDVAHASTKGENNGINGASEKCGKPMGGCVRSRPLARLMRAQSVGTCGRSRSRYVPLLQKPVRPLTPIFWCAPGSHGARKKASKRSATRSAKPALGPVRPAVQVPVPARHGHRKRTTQLQLAFGQLTLLPPRHEPKASKDPMTRLGGAGLGGAGS